MKEKNKCLCKTNLCKKCLGTTCKDDGCKTHRIPDKLRVKTVILNDLKMIIVNLESMIEKGRSEEELRQLWNYRQMSRIREDIIEYTKDVKRLNKIKQ